MSMVVPNIIEDVNELNNNFSKLDHTQTSEATRATMLEDLWSPKLVKHILKKLTTMDEKTFKSDVSPYVVISGAWMIKIKLFTHPFGKLRFHIRPWKSIENETTTVGGNCHIHDFQAFSRVLLGKIEEECYAVTKMDEQSALLYQTFLQAVQQLDSIEQETIFGVLEQLLIWNSISHPLVDKFCTNKQLSLQTLAQRHTFFIGKRYKNEEDKAVESFEKFWDYAFSFKAKREINQWESYFLPVDQWHRVVTEWDTATFFITDTTYKHGALPENNFPLINGHGKRFPRDQKLLEERNTEWYSLSEKEIFTTIQETCKAILETLD